ncbi:hypothetical protein [Novosphingobium sp. PC22D]|uniref:hypothetical protein n=1 Tax=Novosphingobium sp. PC22D TaxID=1962403 RepID=UPI00143AA89A|nr:hypothetical protein [Novosphingobium sp. PC22D]
MLCAATSISICGAGLAAQAPDEGTAQVVTLKRSILDAIARLPAGSDQNVYQAQIAIVVDSALQSGTAAGGAASSPTENRQCLIVLKALSEAAGEPVDTAARKAIAKLRADLRGCSAGTGAGPTSASAAGGGLNFSLPNVNVGGGSDYAQ